MLGIFKEKLKLKFENESFKENNYSFLSLGADIYLNNEKIGIIGVLNNKIKNFYDIDWEVGFMELNLEKLKIYLLIMKSLFFGEIIQKLSEIFLL
jgi:hypothetical protein